MRDGATFFHLSRSAYQVEGNVSRVSSSASRDGRVDEGALNADAALGIVSRTLLLLTFAAALTSTWTGVRIAGINLVDYLLIAATALAVIDSLAKGRRIPIYAWAVIPPVSLLLIALTGSVLQGKSLVADQEAWQYTVGFAAGAEYSGALPFIARMVLSLTAVSMIVVSATENTHERNSLVQKIIFTWAAGAIVSAAYGVLDSFANLGNLPFVYQIVSETRTVSLASHPNSFGQTIAYSIPVLVYMIGVTRGALKAALAFALPVAIYAIYISGSRAALICGVLIAGMTFAHVASAGKKLNLLIVPITGILLIGAIAVFPSMISTSRFFDESGRSSNAIRISRLEKGLDLFYANPLFGAGVGNWNGEMVPLILLASGGLVYFALFYTCLTFPLFARPRLSGNPLMPILIITAVGFFVFGLLNNGLVERYLYWPFAAIFALRLAARSEYEAKLAGGSSVVKPATGIRP